MTDFSGDLSRDPLREDGRTYHPAPCIGCKHLRETVGTAGWVKHHMACGWFDVEAGNAPRVMASLISEAQLSIPRVRIEGPLDETATAQPCPQFET